MEITIAGRLPGCTNIWPVHRFQVQFVHIAWKLIDFLFESAKNVHVMVNDASGMTVSNARNISRYLRLWPPQAVRVKAKQDIAASFIVSAAPQNYFIFVSDRCVSVPSGKEHLNWTFDKKIWKFLKEKSLVNLANTVPSAYVMTVYFPALYWIRWHFLNNRLIMFICNYNRVAF